MHDLNHLIGFGLWIATDELPLVDLAPCLALGHWEGSSSIKGIIPESNRNKKKVS